MQRLLFAFIKGHEVKTGELNAPVTGHLRGVTDI